MIGCIPQQSDWSAHRFCALSEPTGQFMELSYSAGWLVTPISFVNCLEQLLVKLTIVGLGDGLIFQDQIFVYKGQAEQLILKIHLDESNVRTGSPTLIP
jgi:hypothetical protein